MQEFNITDFANSIRTELYNRFPYESDELKMMKHLKTPLHIRDIALTLPTADGDKIIFDIGNDYAEQNYPYYHILQDSEVIRKRGRGTDKSRGSQAAISKLSDRDYGKISWNGKTYTKEYQKNVRGQRSLAAKGTIKVVGGDGKSYLVNKDANYYYNKHFHYIDKTLEYILPWIAPAFGLRMQRTEISDLEDDYQTSEHYGLIASILQSFEEE